MPILKEMQSHTHTHTHTQTLTDKPNSNPELELIGTFETQLSSMKKDLASKDQMLSMYETSMADLSSKVHHLKKTLDEKVRDCVTLVALLGIANT